MKKFKKPFNFKYHLYLDEYNYVKSFGYRIVSCDNGLVSNIHLKPFIFSILAYFKLTRRLLRLNRINVKLLGNRNILIICNFNLYIFSNDKISFKFKFPFTRYVHNESISIRGNTIVIGEYGNSKNFFKVGVFVSEDYGENWTRKILFDKGVVKNILSVKFDHFTDKYWIFTGDAKEECYILIFSTDWLLDSTIGSGDLQYRAISSCFFEDYVVWLMNNPFGDSYVVKYNRHSKIITKEQKLPGPVWYSVNIMTSYFLTTAAETTSEEHGKYVYLMRSTDYIHWKTFRVFKKDCFSKKYFLYGLLHFPEQNGNDKILRVYADAIVNHDGQMVNIDIG